MHWQVKNLDSKEVFYYKPSLYNITMEGCTLKNSKKTAQKIHDGQNKTVCAWINAKHVSVEQAYARVIDESDKVSYNPRKTPNWVDSTGRDMDNMSFTVLQTSGKTVGMVKHIEIIAN